MDARRGRANGCRGQTPELRGMAAHTPQAKMRWLAGLQGLYPLQAERVGGKRTARQRRDLWDWPLMDVQTDLPTQTHTDPRPFTSGGCGETKVRNVSGSTEEQRRRTQKGTRSAMELQGLLLLISAAAFAPAGGNPAVQIQDSFDVDKFYGEWQDIAVGTTCRWMKLYRNTYSMGTLAVGPGKTGEEVGLTSTRLKQGVCTRQTSEYQKTSTPGKFLYSNPKWKTTIETHVASTNYDEYAILVMKKNSTFGFSLTSKLYGRGRALRPDLVADFRRFAVGLGIPEDSVFTLTDKGECRPSPPEAEPQRARRSTVLDEEGSADGSLQSFGGNKEDHCLLPKDAGPCLGMVPRYFHNNASKTCEEFFYGGCLGNGNNFPSERACLQTCRTEAACRLPVLPGAPCNAEFWAFDANLGKCVTFRGCGANANKFYLEKECKEYCGVLPEGEDEFLRLSNR